MILAIAAAFVVVVASVAIPGIHLLFTIPLGPVVAGFIGSSVGKLEDAQILVFGLLVAGLSAIPLGVMVLLVALTEWEPFNIGVGLWVVLAVVLVPFIWFTTTFGALVNYALRRRQARSGG